MLIALTVDARGDLFLSGFSNNTVYRYDDSGALLGGGAFVTAGSGGLSAPHRPMIGADGNLYVASANNDRVLRYNGATGAFIDVFIQPGANGLPVSTLDYPVDMVIGPDGALYVSSQLNDSVVRFNPATGAFIGVFVGVGSGGLDGPSGIAFHNGDLFVAGRFSNQVHRYNGTTGAPVGTGVFATGLSTPSGIAFGADGNAVVANGASSAILKFDGTTGAAIGTFVAPGGGGISAPIGLEFGPGGSLYVASLNNNKVAKFNGTTGASQGDFVAPGSGVSGPNFFTFLPEPGVIVALASGAAILLARRRR